MRVAMIASCCAVTAAALVVVPGSAQEPERPPTVRVTVRALTTPAALGSYCIAAEPNADKGPIAPEGPCVESAYPLRPKGKLPVRPRSRARIDVGTRAVALRARMIRVRGGTFSFVGRSLRPVAIGEDGRHWRVRLPSRLQRANALSIDVDYVDGQANLWAGLRRLGS
jgi:hypothetical protein